MKITNEALDQEFLASKRLQKDVSPTRERYETLKLNNFMASSLRNREIENILRKERLNIIKDIEQTQELIILRYIFIIIKKNFETTLEEPPEAL